jgi:NADP-dependent 3-hydroxy acid dehydrogenase YdfG
MAVVLSNKVALITGASSGIGQATALELARAGAGVVIAARRKERLDALAAQISAVGGAALAVACDAGNNADVDAVLARAIEWRGRLDAVIVNAGRGLAGGILSSDESKWEELYRVNVLGAVHLMRQCALQMIRQKSGDIVAIGSVVGRNISPFSGFYGSSKFAVASAAEGLRREVAAHGVRVSLVMPGIVVSEFQDVAGYTAENFGKSIARFGKLLDPIDIARAIAFIVAAPAHVNVSEIIVRPIGQDYP